MIESFLTSRLDSVQPISQDTGTIRHSQLSAPPF